MSRRAPRAWLISTCCASLLVIACGTSPEEQLLLQFFQAARTLDSSILSRLATVRFSPRTDGSVETFTITTIGPEVQRSDAVEREAVLTSLARAGEVKVDVTGAAVETITRDVTIDARVRSPQGSVSSRTMVVRLQRSIVRGAGAVREGRWIITSLRQTPASQTSRAGSSVPRS